MPGLLLASVVSRWIMTERWFPIVGYEGFYEVSDQVSVRRGPWEPIIKDGA